MLSLSVSISLMLFPTASLCGTTLHPPSPSSFGSSKTAWYYRCLELNLKGKDHNMVKKNPFEKMVLQKNKNRGYEEQKTRNSRFLVNINIMGSAGPIRFVVNEKDLVSGVIHTALKSYAREGRLPVLGFDATNFLLYCANASFDALSPLEPIGSVGVRNFVLCKKQVYPSKTEPQSEVVSPKSSGGWKAWLNKSFGLKILSH
ncbi:hypothetical protein VNO77_43616 [Canavalia gladiata]|uniref:DUF7054 domain-containing protein n=1 Tax=Canavalia gladiata TaxID=3824 RepID=A0AAN9PPK7_CANGL